MINDSSLVSLPNLDAANILHDAVRKEIHPGYIKITIARQCHHEQENTSINDGSKYVQEIDLTPALLTRTNDDNELDLTKFVPPVSRKVPMQQMSRNSLSIDRSRTIASRTHEIERIRRSINIEWADDERQDVDERTT